MKPTEFLKNRFRQAIADRAVQITFWPYEHLQTNVNETTGELLDQNAAYPQSYLLACVLDDRPTKQQREKFGAEDRELIVLSFAVAEFTDRGIEPKEGARVKIPDSISDKYWFVTKVDWGKQVFGEHIAVQLACERKAGFGGNHSHGW